MRLFIAVNFTESIRDIIRASLEQFALNPPPWRWARPDTWHITLKFLGEVDEGRIDALAEAIAPACAAHREFDMELGCIGGFPNLDRPRVLFYSVEAGAAELSGLAQAVDHQLHASLGLERDKRKFHAHATVARVKNRVPPDAARALARMPRLEGAAQRVTSVDLMRSRLGPTGARYSVVKQFALDREQ